jgi:hypothetical protein
MLPVGLSDGGAEEVADAVGEGEPDRTANNDAEYGAPGPATADPSTDCAGDAEGDQYGGEGHRDPPAGGGQQDRE